MLVCQHTLAAAPNERPASGEGAEDFEVPQPGKVGIEQLGVRLCFQEDAVDTKAIS